MIWFGFEGLIDLLNSVQAPKASIADFVSMNEIQVMREKSSTKMMKYLLPPMEIGNGPPMSECMSSNGVDARDCGTRLMCSVCLPARQGGYASLTPRFVGAILDVAISDARPDANSRTDCLFKCPNLRCQTLIGRGAEVAAFAGDDMDALRV